MVTRTLLLTGMFAAFFGLSNSTYLGDEALADQPPIPGLLCGQGQLRSLVLPINFQAVLAGTKFASVPAGNGPVPLIKGLNKVRVPVPRLAAVR